MSTATITRPQPPAVDDAAMIQAAREAAGMSPGYQAVLWEAYVDRQLQALEHAIERGMPHQALKQLFGHCVSLLEVG